MHGKSAPGGKYGDEYFLGGSSSLSSDASFSLGKVGSELLCSASSSKTLDIDFEDDVFFFNGRLATDELTERFLGGKLMLC